MSELLKTVRVRKMDSDDKLDINVTVISKRGNKFEVLWLPQGGVSTKFEYDADQKIYKDKKIYFDEQIKSTSSVYNLSNAAGSYDQYSNIGPALLYLLPTETASKMTYGFNPKRWTEGDAFINEAIKTKETQDQAKYEVFQDPTSSGSFDAGPKIRRFGFDPYFVENGASVVISWREGTTVVGGREWSTNGGTELRESRLDGKKKDGIKKTARITSYDGKEVFYLGKDEKLTKEGPSKEWDGYVFDDIIFSEIIRAWETAIPGYQLNSLAQPNKGSGLGYKSPFEPTSPNPPVTNDATGQGASASQGQGQNTPKNLLSVKIPDGTLKAKTDLPPFEVIYTDPKAIIAPEDQFQVSEDGTLLDGDNLELLDEEYTETDYAGEDEAAIEIHIGGNDATLPAPVLKEVLGPDGKPNTDPAKGPVAAAPASASALSGKIKVTVGGTTMNPKSNNPLREGGKMILHWTHRPNGGWLEKQKYPEPGEYILVTRKAAYGYSANINGIYHSLGGGCGWASFFGNAKAADGGGKTIQTLLKSLKHYVNCDMVIYINGASQPVEARAPFDCKVVGVQPSWGNITLLGTGVAEGKSFNFTHCTSPKYNTNKTFINTTAGVDPGYSKDLASSVKVGKTFKKGEKMGFFQGNVCPGEGSGGVHFHLDCMTFNDLEQYVIDLLTLGWYDS